MWFALILATLSIATVFLLPTLCLILSMVFRINGFAAASQDFIPAKDTDLDDWSTNFSAVITSAPTAYGLISGDATSFATLQSNFHDSLAAATTPATRTAVTVETKVTDRNAMVAGARGLAKRIQAYASITNDLLAAAGLTIRSSIPSPVPAPTTNPIISLIQSNSKQLVLRYRDSVLSNPRSRPKGAIGMQIFIKVGGAGIDPPTDTNGCIFAGQYTRMPATLGGEGQQYQFDDAAIGKPIYIIGRWYTARGLVGPNSPLFTQTLAA